MRQYSIVNKIVQELIKNNYISACYVGGSLGRQDNDKFSDIDLYCNFFTETDEDFEENKISIFETCGVFIFQKKKDDLDTVVYTDGIVLKLHHIYPESNGIINVDKNVKIIYNPYNIINQTNDNSFEYSNDEIGEVIDGISLKALEFYRTYLKNDFPIMLRLASDMHYMYSCLKHYVSEPNYAKLGGKNIMVGMNQEERIKYVEIIKNYSFSNLKQFVKMIINDVSYILGGLPVVVATSFNIDFFEFVKKKIIEL